MTGVPTGREERAASGSTPLETEGSPPVVLDLTHPRRRRRPTGTPAPLPKTIGLTGKLWLAAVFVVVVLGSIWLHSQAGPLDRFDAVLTRGVVAFRTSWLDSLARALNSLGSRWGLAALGLATVGLVMFFRRWRHLVVFLISLAVLENVAGPLYLLAERPRPLGVTQIAGWEGYASPSLPVTTLTAVLVGLAFMLVPAGRVRWHAKLAILVIVATAGILRIYLGIDHATDLVFGAILGVAIPVALFRAFVPNDAFPVTYGHRGKSAHLDVSGRRGEAIRQAMQEQLGFSVVQMKLVGLEGSGGSTPLKLRVVDEHGAERSVFAKLYAKNHVRADRWYKLGRTMLYGSLEDETPFKTVRRFVEYEDYTLRLLGEYGFPTPAPLGVVEITPEREYLIAMEFFEDAREIGEAEVDDRVIDEGLRMIRRMWDVGLAHRDIKPANLMVQEGRLRLIDVFFVQVRPSPWRQAVDLANMMLVLALRSDAQTVYRKALDYFTPEELSEAFAAARGVASPTQLRSMMKQDRPELLDEFRSLLPARRPIAIQRWSFRRVGLILLTLLVVVFAFTSGLSLFFPSRGEVRTPSCGTDRAMVLMGQAVPSATRLPCVDKLPLGWDVATATIVRGRVTFTANVGMGASSFVVEDGQAPVMPLVEVTLTPSCSTVDRASATEVFDVQGGCVVYRSSIPPDRAAVPSFDAGGGLSFVDRSEVVAAVDRDEDLRLCGVGVECP
jgi:tRNA A-37 threonylcarbamoyl transferase component Bud32